MLSCQSKAAAVCQPPALLRFGWRSVSCQAKRPMCRRRVIELLQVLLGTLAAAGSRQCAAATRKIDAPATPTGQLIRSAGLATYKEQTGTKPLSNTGPRPAAGRHKLVFDCHGLT